MFNPPSQFVFPILQNPPQFATEWMTDFDALQDALSQDDSYMSNLSRSMGLVLEEFYNHMTVCACAMMRRGSTTQNSVYASNGFT